MLVESLSWIFQVVLVVEAGREQKRRGKMISTVVKVFTQATGYPG